MLFMLPINKTIRISRIIHIILPALVCLMLAGPVFGQVKFYTVVSETTVSHRQTFQVQYVVEGANSISQFKLPRFRDFETVDVFDHSSSVILSRGTYTYSMIVVLLATQKGQFTIPGATAVINGKPMRSNTARIQVMQTGLPGMSYINPDDIDTEEESVLHPGESITEKVQKNFFLRVEPSKTSCYVGEPLMVVYKAYSRLNANSQVVKRPSLTGFSVMEMVDAYDGKPEIEKLNGRLYYTNLIRKVQLFPLQEGTFTLDAAEIESVIHFVKTNEPADRKEALKRMFDRSAAPQIITPVNYRTILRTEPLKITVKPLPEANQPSDYAGAVGQFTLTVKVPSVPIRKGDLVKIQVAITGSGNISLLTPPDIDWPAGVDTAEPSVKENVNKYTFPLTGSKVFEYSFAAPDTGDYVIPAVRLPYYDPADKTYKTAISDSITMHVLPGLQHKDDLKSKESVTSRQPSIPRQFYWFGLVALVIVGCIVFQVVLLGKNKRTEGRNPNTSAKTEATSEPAPPVDPLAAARLALQQQDPPAFFHEVQQALWAVVAEQYKVLPSQLNKHHIEALLANKEVPHATIQNFTSVLDECEWALYTPHHSTSSMEGLLGRAEEVIRALS
jgi:hypothetical protein